MPVRPDPAEVVDMFDRLAPRYDAMNTFMTGGLDRRWRRDTIRALELPTGARVLDVATGSGRLAREAAGAAGPGGDVMGLDPSLAMLAEARRLPLEAGAARLTWVQADAMAMPFADGTFDGVTIGFGLRNLPDPAAAVREMARVLATGGRLAVLEIARPVDPMPRLVFSIWLRRLVPMIGRLIGQGSAYAYLPRSLDTYPGPSAVAELMADAGLVDVRWRWLTGRLVTLHVGTQPGAGR